MKWIKYIWLSWLEVVYSIQWEYYNLKFHRTQYLSDAFKPLDKRTRTGFKLDAVKEKLKAMEVSQ